MDKINKGSGRPFLDKQKVKERKLLIAYIYNETQSFKAVSEKISLEYSSLLFFVKNNNPIYKIIWTIKTDDIRYSSRMQDISRVFDKYQSLGRTSKELKISYSHMCRFMNSFGAKYILNWKDM